MCGIRSCMALLQWMTDGKATKNEGEVEEGPRPVKKGGDGKWDVRDTGEKEKRDEKRGGGR